MTSESSSATTAQEQRFRVDKPNSMPRAAMLIGLDPASRQLVDGLVAARPERRRSFDLGCDGLDAGALAEWLAALPARTQALTDAIDDANIVVVVAAAGIEAEAASLVGDACRTRGVRMTALVVNADRQDDAQVAFTLARLRPGAAMVVVAGNDAYVEDMLSALQA